MKLIDCFDGVWKIFSWKKYFKWLFIGKMCFLEELWKRASNIQKNFPLVQSFEISSLLDIAVLISQKKILS